MFNPVASYLYPLPNMYLTEVCSANPDLLACGCRTWINLDIVRFYEDSASHPAGSHTQISPPNVNQAPMAGAGGVGTICTELVRPL